MYRMGPMLMAVLLAAPAGAADSKPGRTSAAFLEGWDDFVLDGDQRPGLLELRLQLSGEGWDNLRQSPDSTHPEPTAGARSEARLTFRPFSALPVKTHAEAGQMSYRTRPAMSGVGGGVAFEGDRHTLHLSTRIERNRPSVDIGVGGDVTNDAFLMRLRYALRTRRAEWWAGADRAQQRFAEAAFRDGTLQGLQTGLSIPGVRRLFTPELLFAWSRNDGAGDSEFDWQHRRAQIGLRYTPTRAVALTARFELSEMSWGVTRPTAVNFERRDRRRYLSLQGQVRLTRQAAWTLVYDRLDNRSTRANRGFSSNYVSAALTVRLGSTSNAPGAPKPGAPAAVPLAPRAVDSLPAAPPLPVVPIAPPAAPAARVEPVAVVDQGGGGVSRIETVLRGAETETTIRSEGLVRYSTLDLDGPPRFVIDLVGVAAAPLNVSVDTPLLRGIRVAAFRTTPSRVARVVFDLKGPVAARIEREGDSVRVILRPVVESASTAR